MAYLNVQNMCLPFIQYSTVGHLGISILAAFATTGLSIYVCHETDIQCHSRILFLLHIVHLYEVVIMIYYKKNILRIIIVLVKLAHGLETL